VAHARIAAAAEDQAMLGIALEECRSAPALRAPAALATVAGFLAAPRAGEIAAEALELAAGLGHGGDWQPSKLAACVEAVSDCPAAPGQLVEELIEAASQLGSWGLRARLLAALSMSAGEPVSARLRAQVEGEPDLVEGWIASMGDWPGDSLDRARRQQLAALAAAVCCVPPGEHSYVARLAGAVGAARDPHASAVLLAGLPARCREDTRTDVALRLLAAIEEPLVRHRALGLVPSGERVDAAELTRAVGALVRRDRPALVGDLAALGELIAAASPAEENALLLGLIAAIQRWWP